MTVIHKYVATSFIRYFGLVLMLVVVIYLSVDFIGRIDNFIESGRSAGAVALFFLLKIPLILSQITPLGVLLSVLIIFGLMNKNNEVIALKSGGVSVFYLLVPVVILGFILSGLLFVFSEVVVPISAAEAGRIAEKQISDGADAVSSRERNIWIRHGRHIVHVKYYHPADRVLSGVSIYGFDRDFNLVHRIDAASAEYQQGRWVFFDCTEQRFSPQTAKRGAPAAGTRVRHVPRKTMDLDLAPAAFKKVARESEEMSFTALWHYIEKTAAEGYDTTKYEVDLYAKTAFPMVCLIMSLMAGGIALRGKTRDGMAVSFAYGMITAFVYWSVYSFCLSLGYGDVLPPWLAAWSANILFFLAAGVLLLNLE